MKDYTSPQDILGAHGLLMQLTKRVVERVLEAELTAHLGYAPHRRQWAEEKNARNGKGQKTLQTDTGPLARRSRGTARGALPRSWCPSASAASRAATTKS